MKKTSRNAPCPCGSGKKHKKCCLVKIEQQEAQWALRNQAMTRAMKWMAEHHRDDIDVAMRNGYCSSLSDEQLAQLMELSHELKTVFQGGMGEWLLSDGEASIDGEPVRFIDLILGEGGPPLEVRQRDYLRMLAEQPLGLYEVVEVELNEGIWLVDKLQQQQQRIRIQERSATHSLQRGDVIAARVIPTEPKVMSGLIYPFSPHEAVSLRRAITEAPIDKDQIGDIIIARWLAKLVGPPPEMTDFSGQPIALTTVQYRVKNWNQFETVIKNQPDVIGDSKDGWSRLEGDRPLYSIRRTMKDQAELFAMTRERAEAGERWVEEISAGALEKTVRKVSDPTQLWKDRHKLEETKRPRKPDDFIESLSGDERNVLYEQIYRKTYARWADEPIPALGDKAPREAVRTEEGRHEVLELLRSYETNEAQQAEKQSRPPVSFDFLWEQLGLRRHS